VKQVKNVQMIFVFLVLQALLNFLHLNLTFSYLSFGEAKRYEKI